MIRSVFIVGLWLALVYAVCQTTQSTYEDHRQIQRALDQQSPNLFGLRGLATMSIWLQAHISTSPAIFRAVNLGLGGLVSLLVGAIAWKMGASGWLAGGAMALHPLTVETMAMISGRRELVAALGVLAAVGVMVWSRQDALFAASLMAGLALLMALGGKESAIVGLMLVPLAALATLRGDYGKQSARIALLAGVSLVVWACWSHRLVGEFPNIQMSDIAWAQLQTLAAARLIVLSIVPFHQTVDYDYNALPQLFIVTAPVVLALLVVYAVSLWREHRVAAFGLAWVAIVILPRLIVHTPTSYFNEHEWYLALAGVAFAVDGLVMGPRTA